MSKETLNIILFLVEFIFIYILIIIHFDFTLVKERLEQEFDKL